MSDTKIRYYAVRGLPGGNAELIRVDRGGPEAGVAGMETTQVAVYGDHEHALDAMRRANGVA